MREIKFRAFNIRRKKMHSVSDIKWLPYGAIRIDVAGENGYDPLLYMPNYEGEELKEYELMQYTQLQDNNDKEIYDKDIVKTVSGVGIVEWSADSLLWVVRISDRCSDWLMTYESDIEVIGNIYENPKLMEGLK